MLMVAIKILELPNFIFYNSFFFLHECQYDFHNVILSTTKHTDMLFMYYKDYQYIHPLIILKYTIIQS